MIADVFDQFSHVIFYVFRFEIFYLKKSRKYEFTDRFQHIHHDLAVRLGDLIDLSRQRMLPITVDNILYDFRRLFRHKYPSALL